MGILFASSKNTGLLFSLLAIPSINDHDHSYLMDNLSSPKQLPDNPGNMVISGQSGSTGCVCRCIQFNDTTSQSILTDAKSAMTTRSRATKLSYLEWTTKVLMRSSDSTMTEILLGQSWGFAREA